MHNGGWNRRALLRFSGLAVASSVAGCSALGGGGTTTSARRATTTTVGSWNERTKLSAAEGNTAYGFGQSVALSADGTTALLGAPRGMNPEGKRSGSAYVFSRAGDTWSQAAKLAADDGDAGDYFGDAVALSADGTTAIVGAWGDEDPNGDTAGSAYVFSRTGDSWRQVTKLVADDGNARDYFGDAVALSADGTTTLVGASEDENPNGSLGGSAYLFDRSGNDWSQAAKLAAGDGDSYDVFGEVVALSADGTTALLGAPGNEDPNGRFAGSAHVFEQDGGRWSYRTKIAAGDGDSIDNFGHSVALSADGTTALLGAPGNEDPNGGGSAYKGGGSAYVFSRAGDTWSQAAKLAATDGDADDIFGQSVALSADGTTAVIGARWDEDPNGERAGSAYVFSRTEGSWRQVTKLAAADGDSSDNFGHSVALSAEGTTALVGANEDEGPDGSGSAYVFDE